jgi:hypothetical protein
MEWHMDININPQQWHMEQPTGVPAILSTASEMAKSLQRGFHFLT